MTSPCSRPARNSMVSNRSQTGALPSRRMSARRAMRLLASTPGGRGGARGRAARRAGEAPLDGRHQQLPDADPKLLVELADPGGTGDVDLGHEAADHVEADEQHPLDRKSTRLNS